MDQILIQWTMKSEPLCLGKHLIVLYTPIQWIVNKQLLVYSTNRLVPQGGESTMTNIPKVDDVITKIDKALLDYEVTIGVAATEGLEIATKEIHYQWTYVQSVFFTSTIITTVGK